MTEADYIKKSLQLIEDKFSWSDHTSWTSYHFQELSEKILIETKISISPKTLKRISGQEKTYYKDQYNPQPQTKEALALFLGYKDWEDFKTQNAGTSKKPAISIRPSFQSSEEVKALTEEAVNPPVILRKKGGRRSGVLVLFLLILFSLVFFYWFQKPEQPTAELSALYTKGTAPLLVTFTMNVSGSKEDTIRLDFGDGSEPQIIPKGRTTLSFRYYRPGYYTARIVWKNRTLSSIGVLASTDNWQSIIQYNKIPFPVDLPRHDGMLHISPEEVYAKKIIRNTEFWIKYLNVRDYTVDGDNFKIECRIKNSDKEGGIDCFDFYLELVGERSGITTQILRPGCEIWGYNQFSDVILKSTSTDLSSFGQNLSDWRVLKLQVKNKRATVYIDDKLIYTVSYQKPMGGIKSITLVFKGCGAVDFVRVYNDKDKLAYDENF